MIVNENHHQQDDYVLLEEFHRSTVAVSAAEIVESNGVLEFLEAVDFYVDNPRETVILSRVINLIKENETWLYSGVEYV